MKHYDIIIAGGGMAGLSLCYYLSRSSLRESSILLIDREAKTRNDRTWCFWESGAGPFESIMFRRWRSIEFCSQTVSGPLSTGPYTYKMLRGIDFYRFVHEELASLPNIDIHYSNIDAIEETQTGGKVKAGNQVFSGNYVFDSVSAFKANRAGRHNLLQHFRGWVITTERDCFDTDRPRIMDFRVAQQNHCRFFYVLPFNKRTALVEYTVFSQQQLSEQEYKDALSSYIGKFLDAGNYQILETEAGVIPMSDEVPLKHPSGHVIRIGTAGGYTKPSTGYTFQRTQHYLSELVTSLAKTGKPVPRKLSLNGQLKHWLDTVFLNVLIHNRHPAEDLFTRLFTSNGPTLMFRFMDEHTTVAEDLRVIGSMPKVPFAIAAIDALVKKVRHLV